jgi:hypothetical protein
MDSQIANEKYFPGTVEVARSIFWLALTAEQQEIAAAAPTEQERRALVHGFLQELEKQK